MNRAAIYKAAGHSRPRTRRSGIVLHGAALWILGVLTLGLLPWCMRQRRGWKPGLDGERFRNGRYAQ